jgi:D-3-phosphoglycerate dehydrogenase
MHSGKAMMTKVLITPKSYYAIRRQMQPLLEGMAVVFNDTGKTLTEAEMMARIVDVDGLLVGVDPVSRRVIEKAKRLRAVSKYGVGIDNIDLEALAERRIPLKTAPGTNKTSVAELTFGLLLAITRNIWRAAQQVKDGGWQREQGVEITGKTLGIIGCGSIGREVARRARGFLMSVLVFDPYFKDADFRIQNAIEQVPLDDLLARSDFISLHLPLTPETRGIIDRNRLQRMKTEAYLINTSRGELIDEAALAHALKRNMIAGAACDVWTQEPPGNHPLLQLDNFILTPHMGATTREAVLRMARAATFNLTEMLRHG